MKFEDFKDKLEKSYEHLNDELLKIRTGRVQTSLIEDIRVNAYEGMAPLTVKELGAISILDNQTLLVEVWDESVVDKVAKAIRESGTNLNPAIDGKLLRVPVPSPTEETRKNTVKQVGAKVEEARISVRNIRQDAFKALEEQKENGVISEDEYFRLKKQYDESVSEINKKILDLGKAKEQEILNI